MNDSNFEMEIKEITSKEFVEESFSSRRIEDIAVEIEDTQDKFVSMNTAYQEEQDKLHLLISQKKFGEAADLMEANIFHQGSMNIFRF